MSFFTPNYEKPGPGISKDAPPKKGIALFFEILIREFWQLIKLNLIFVISCIPIITIGPAISGLSKSTTKMVRDIPNDVWDDFKTGFRENFSHSVLIGTSGIILFAGCYLGFALYSEHFLLQTTSLVVLVLLTNVWIYIFPLLTSTTLPMTEALRNAFLLGSIRFYLSIPVALFCIFYIGVQLILFPFSIPLALFLGFSIPSFISSFIAWSGISRYIIKESQEEK